MLLVAWPTTGLSQESVQTAQTLYASASYDEALALLDRLQRQELTPSEVRVVNQQRVLCLLALGRAQAAEQAIAAVVQADPTYSPDGASASPRVRNAFRDVRGRLLPGIVQVEYAEARSLYDASSWAAAASAFQRVSALAADHDLAEAQVAALADVKVLADGFAKLAEAAATPPAPGGGTGAARSARSATGRLRRDLRRQPERGRRANHRAAGPATMVHSQRAAPARDRHHRDHHREKRSRRTRDVDATDGDLL